MNLRNSFLLLTLTAALVPAADPSLLAMLPKDPKMVAGLDVDRARNSAFGQRILAEMKDEDKGFREFVQSTGFDPRRDMREVLMSSDGAPNGADQSLVVVRGTFDANKFGAYFRSQGATLSYYKGIELWSDPKSKDHEGGGAILNSSLALFGRSEAVKAAIDRRAANQGGLSADIAKRVSEWSSKNDAWFVSGDAFGQLGVNKDGKNAVLPGNLSTDAILRAAAGVRFGSTIDISGETLARSDKDASALADVFRFMASMIRLNAKPGMEDAVKIADSLQLQLDGATLRFSLSVPEDQLEKMLEKKGSKAKVASAKKPEII